MEFIEPPKKKNRFDYRKEPIILTRAQGLRLQKALGFLRIGSARKRKQTCGSKSKAITMRLNHDRLRLPCHSTPALRGE
jgi:hypothetical protein